MFEPIQIGGTLFRNRVFASPTGHHEMTPDCFPDVEVVSYYEQKAKGGAASVGVGDCIVHSRTGQSHTKQIHIDDPLVLPSLTAVAAAISRHGAVAAAELSHGGKFSHVLTKVGGKIESPPFLKDGSGITYGPVEEIGPLGNHVLEMPESVILEIIDAFGRAAAFAKHCGFGMVTIHGGHGWLLAQFMSEATNTRRDRWGGSFENRMRLTLAVVDSVRRAVGPGFPVEFRLSGDEAFEGGYHIDFGVEMAKQLDGKVDMIHVSTGNHEVAETFIVTHPNMFLPEGCNVKYAAEIKKHVKTPVATVGALADPEYMEEIIASGQADVVQIARELLVDPDFVNKVRTGREDDAHRCLRCETCFSNAFSNRYHRCAINPRIGTYSDSKFETPPARKGRLLVVGGGVAGMQAALTAAERGHEVILCEKEDRLGGVLNCERGVPFKARLAGYLDRQARKVGRAAIDLRLGVEVGADYAEALRPDAIIVAAGASSVVPPIPGIDGPNVRGAIEVYQNPEIAGGRVVIIGAGLVGLELAIHLGGEGRDVTVVEMADETNDGGNTIHAIAVNQQLRLLGIPVELSTRAVEIGAEGLVGESAAGGRRLFPADTVIYAAGRRPLWELARELRFCAPQVEFVGDCRAPRVIADATREAYWVARDIGAF
jgi:2,4-dienoyl-CoA reductase-like NADH-dependent reductase (Old Yellow Enzyme family)/thioredoxin reductase